VKRFGGKCGDGPPDGAASPLLVQARERSVSKITQSMHLHVLGDPA